VTEETFAPVHPEFIGSLPKQLYMVKFVARTPEGGRRTYAFPFVDKASFVAFGKRLSSPGMLDAGTVATTHVGTITWEQTDDIDAWVEPPVELPPNKKPTYRKKKSA